MSTDQQGRAGFHLSWRMVGSLAMLTVVGVLIAVFVRINNEATRVITHSESRDNISSLLRRMTDRDGRVLPWHRAHTGRNFILAVVASGAYQPGAPHLRPLWPPGRYHRAEEIGLAAYEEITWKSLVSRRFPHLTGYAGPSEAPLSKSEDAFKDGGIPLIADLTRPDGILVGFSSGRVGSFDWDYLGIAPPDGPVPVGPGAPHPLLRALSND